MIHGNLSKNQSLDGGHLPDRCGQIWFLDVSLSWRIFGGQMRTGADKSGQLWFLGVSLIWRTGADSWTYGGHMFYS